MPGGGGTSDPELQAAPVMLSLLRRCPSHQLGHAPTQAVFIIIVMLILVVMMVILLMTMLLMIIILLVMMVVLLMATVLDVSNLNLSSSAGNFVKLINFFQFEPGWT